MNQDIDKLRNNHGFSLIEMIVTLLASSMVFATASLLLITGLNQYKMVNAETVLQEESQIAQFFVTEQFQEAMNYNVIADGSLPSGYNKAVEIQKADGWYILAKVGNELRYGKADGADTSERLTDFSGKAKSKTFLASNISELTFNVNSFTEAKNYGYVYITYKFAFQGKSYSTNSVINLRNGKIN